MADALFEAQCLNGIERRRLPRRIEPEEDPDRGGEADGEEHRRRWRRDAPTGEPSNERRTADAGGEAEQATEQTNDDAFHEKLQHHGRTEAPDRHADADLSRTLRDRHEHDVHDPDPADDE